MAPAMLRACDEFGMYVMDETFDMWNRCKSDYGLYFNEWWETDVTAKVRKDYHNPCVIGQVVGNVNVFMSVMDKYMDEITMQEAITKRLEKACAETDIAGYNYMTVKYEKDGENYPNRFIVGCETYPPEI